MLIAVLFPSFDHQAIEERYSSWQSAMRLRGNGPLSYYGIDEQARGVAGDIDTEFVLVVTDPLLIVPAGLAERLHAAIGDAAAAVPLTNESEEPRQRAASPAAYMTLREFEVAGDALRRTGSAAERVTWGAADPGIFLCRTGMLDDLRVPLRQVLSGRPVAIVPSEFVHRWSSMRGQPRADLLERIPTDAKKILEFGCGEGALGAALKHRQRCSVVGLELDPQAAAVAKRRLDDVYCGDARHLITLLDEQFDWLIGGDIVEHLDDPWSFLGELTRITATGGHLLLSLPNLANASVVGDLLRGRFDYVYMGLTCVGHVRFFTRQSIEEMLTMTGWTAERIEPQPVITTPSSEALLRGLEAGGIEHSREDLLAPGYYVTARKR